MTATEKTILTGVVNLNSLSSIGLDEILSTDSINLEFIEHCKTCKEEYHDQCWEDQPSDTLLIGFKEGYNGEFLIDDTQEFSCIIRESVIQIVKSEYTKKGSLCSPCYPNQVDLDSEGEYEGYTLPEYFFTEE